MANKSFPCREILPSSMHLPRSPNVWALFLLGPYFLVVFYSQWTYIGDGLISFRPMDMDPSSPSCRAHRALFLSSSVAPFTPFGPSLSKKGSQLGRRSNNYNWQFDVHGLTAEISAWTVTGSIGWLLKCRVDGDKVNRMIVRKNRGRQVYKVLTSCP